MAHRNRARRSLRRKSAKRAPRKIVVLVTEGLKTEPEYFKKFNSLFDKSVLELRIVKGVGVPSTVVDVAIEEKERLQSERRKNSFANNDEVWAVFDRDEHPSFHEKCIECLERQIELACSNPCFELWLILHFENFGRQDSRHAVQKRLQQLWPAYDPKGQKCVDLGALFERLEAAENRAEAHERQRQEEGDRFGCPSSSVYKLTRSLRGG